ncbi:MAG: tRNA pseudouridine(55) synthase TruB [Anaerovibrio sp.]|uniref:tRNA pseudouridine(55) synthase TruB n=1 Tax=Anaerovibrio sp. TaxID=1872532 RepID=UPI0025DAE5EE|nr:tRNA pseudouridine(55) synthase TruB [Anaerovibrio sp.]MCR5175727.1 tRNA pseudouridine(55) synthase TruB [Anaerovibrio sp.]
MDGFINFLKPPGMTSHDAVSLVRRVLREKRVGHAGTLDPGAAGVLPIAVGKATRLIEYLDTAGKSYRAEMMLGIETDSGDDTGTVVAEAADCAVPDEADIIKVFKGFTGVIEQVPPAYSAIKINGRRACDLVRQGLTPDIPSRTVEIHSLILLDRDESNKRLLFDVSCSRGTYIRTLCQDMGRAMGIPATMSFLVRTAVGSFILQDSVSAEELKVLGGEALIPYDLCIGHIKKYQISPARRKAFCNGLSSFDRELVKNNNFSNNICLRVYCGEDFLGMGHYDANNQTVVPDKVLWTDRD